MQGLDGHSWACWQGQSLLGKAKGGWIKEKWTQLYFPSFFLTGRGGKSQDPASKWLMSSLFVTNGVRSIWGEKQKVCTLGHCHLSLCLVSIPWSCCFLWFQSFSPHWGDGRGLAKGVDRWQGTAQRGKQPSIHKGKGRVMQGRRVSLGSQAKSWVAGWSSNQQSPEASDQRIRVQASS